VQTIVEKDIKFQAGVSCLASDIVQPVGNVTRPLQAMHRGEAQAAEQLLSPGRAELRVMARFKSIPLLPCSHP